MKQTQGFKISNTLLKVQTAIILCIAIQAAGQNVDYAKVENIKKLEKIIIETDSFEVKVDAHNRLARAWMSNDTSKAFFHLRRVDSIARDNNDTKGLYAASVIRAGYYYNTQNVRLLETVVDSQIKYTAKLHEKYRFSPINLQVACEILKGNTRRAMELTDSIIHLIGVPINRNDSIEITSHYLNAAAHAVNLNDYQAGLDYSIRALEIVHPEDLRKRTGANNNLGYIYRELGDYETSIEYLKKAIEFSRRLNDKNQESLALINMAKTFKGLNELDSSRYYFELAIDASKTVGNTLQIGDALIELGDIEKSVSNCTEALNYYTNALEQIKKIDNKKRLADINLKVAECYIQNQQYELAELKTPIDQLISEYERQENLKSTVKAYQLQSQLMLGLGKREKAIKAFNHFTKLNDSLSTSIFNQEVASLKVEFETTQKEAQIEQQQLKIQSQNTEKRYILSLGIGAFSLLGLFLWSIFSRAKRDRRIAHQAQRIQNQKIVELQKEKKILSMSSMIEGQESERKRIAQDLHDGLGGLLATIKVKFGIIQNEIAALESMNVYQQTTTMIDDACTEVRKIAHNMMPDSLIKLGIVDAVRDIAEYTADINIKVINLGIHSMAETQEIMLYRVIQEFLNNSRKHAKATEVIIQFSIDEKNTIIYLEDNGKGFDPLEINLNSGLGLKSMESRVNFLGGSFDLDSVIGVGTTLQIHLPKL